MMDRRYSPERPTRVVRRQALTKEEVAKYQRMQNFQESTRRALRDLILDLLDGVTERTEDWWEEIARELGFDNRAAVHELGYGLKVDYQAREVQLLKNVPDKPASKENADEGDHRQDCNGGGDGTAG
jgi:hypothetical protein